MDRLPVTPGRRAVLVAFLAASVLAVLAATADAEEAFVLDNGSVLRGNVLREEGDAVEIRLSGRGMRGTVTVERSRIVQRFVTVDPEFPARGVPTGPSAPYVAPAPGNAAPLVVPATAPAPSPAPPAASPATGPSAAPSLAEEGFHARFVRRASAALPPGAGARAFLVALALAVLTALVALGARMAEIDEANLGRCTVVAFLLGALIGVSAASAGAVTRSDVAPLVLPVALLAWAALAAAVFRCGFGRAFTLLAFVLVAGALVLFTTGVVITAL